MCLLIFAHQIFPKHPLVLAANRDEFYARPTAPSDFWKEHPGLLAGKDLDQGGTWMGITRSGRIAAITNFRDPARTAPGPRSRGELPLKYLNTELEPSAFLAEIASSSEEYAGFNLLIGDSHQLWYFSNSTEGHEPKKLTAGIYGLSNASLNTPWPKVELGKSRMQLLLDKGVFSHKDLAATVADTATADLKTLSEQGKNSAMEQLLSAQFICTQAYGTRSTTTLWFEAEGRASWEEQTFSTTGALASTQRQAFALT